MSKLGSVPYYGRGAYHTDRVGGILFIRLGANVGDFPKRP